MKMPLISTQLIRYAIIGVVTNGSGYVLYLAMTWGGMGHKLTMTLLYIVGALLSFLLNRRWTFNHSGAVGRAMVRHWAVFGLGYVVNFVALLIFVDLLGLPHEIVQGVMVLTLACMLFVLQKLWVFPALSSTA